MKRVFVSYSHCDQALRAELDMHLALLKREGALDIWTDHLIPAGGDVDATISAGLEGADIVLLLISAEFIASDYCYSIEMSRAMQRHEGGDCTVVPIILRPCDWKTAPFGHLKVLPTDSKPVTRWPSHDDAFDDIVQHLRRLLAAAALKPAAKASPVLPQINHTGNAAASLPYARVTRSSNLSLPRTFSDQEKYDFTVAAFGFIRDYFTNSLSELQARNVLIETRMSDVSPQAFTAIVFREGKRIAGCRVRYGGGYSPNAIAWSDNENASDTSYNELLLVGADAHKLYFSASMALFHGGDAKKTLSEEGAAEHLWSMLIRPIQRFSGPYG